MSDLVNPVPVPIATFAEQVANKVNILNQNQAATGRLGLVMPGAAISIGSDGTINPLFGTTAGTVADGGVLAAETTARSTGDATNAAAISGEQTRALAAEASISGAAQTAQTSANQALAKTVAATSTVIGLVKPDNSSVVVSSDGTVSAKFGTVTGSVADGGVLAAVQTTANAAIPLSQIGIASGVTPLDSSGYVPLAHINPALLGAQHYIGVWNAETNSPAIASGTSPGGTNPVGSYYVVDVAGSTEIDGVSTWNIGDWIVWDGTKWDKLDGQANPVSAFNGRQGAINLLNTDVAGVGGLLGANNLSDIGSAPTARANLGLGTAATLTAGGANGAAVLDASGNASAFASLSTGTTTARSLAARGADSTNVKDWGAILNGSASDSTAFQSAYNAVANSGVIDIPTGNLNATITSSSSKSVLWRALGTLDNGTSSPGTNPVTTFGDGDVLETFLGGRKHFSKTTVNSTNFFATVDISTTINNATITANGTPSALNLAGTNNTNINGSFQAGVWTLKAQCNVNGSASDNYAIAGTTVLSPSSTGWGGCQYLQLFDNAGVTGHLNVVEYDMNTMNSDPIGSGGPSTGLRSVVSFNLATTPQVSGAPTAQAARGITVGTPDGSGASIGAVFFSNASIYYAGLDVSQATFQNSSVAAVRMAAGMPIDLSGTPTNLNQNTILFNSSTASFEYWHAGSAVFGISTAGKITASGGLQLGGAIIDVSTTLFTPTAGSTINLSNNAATVIISPSGTLASLTVSAGGAATTASDASVRQLIIFTQAITSLTWTHQGAAGFSGAPLPASVTAGQAVLLVYEQSGNTWYHTIGI